MALDALIENHLRRLLTSFQKEHDSDGTHAAAPGEDWTLIGGGDFLNSWVNYGSVYTDAGYYKDSHGVVHIRGRIKSGSVGSPAFQLPAGYRPGAREMVAVPSNGLFGIVYIDQAGQVVPFSPSSNIYVSLDGVSFRVT